ncbi:glycosyltransferase family 4 protein [Paenibacillus favisporus]|uniref:glycosyltransferase family 4 protein n=1 Tax=Paenibacillus favisporus TaxID=221028 RepID=UPI002DB95FF9|nr:glycosyltransferase family 4 protein [Paenibacillus favisporus]MEC0178127.1 glycosyltransferase family 4 protein [Paenibacillus favisporus]
MKKKVLYICEATAGGVRKHIIDVLDHIDTSKYDMSIIYSEIGADEVFRANIDTLKKKGIQLYSVNNFVNHISLFDDLKALYQIVKIIKKVQPEIVHCHSSKAGAIGRLAAKICRINQVIYTPHAYSFQNQTLNKNKRNAYIFIEKFLGKITTLTINVSEGERQYAIEKNIVKEDNSVVIFNGITSNSISVNPIQNKTIRIGTTMRMEIQKDPLTFVEIAKRIVEKYSNVEFIFVGDGQLKEELYKRIRMYKLEEKVKLLGFKKDVIDIVSTFDVYLITSLYEGLPYSVIEALSLEKPIIATNVTGNNEIVIDGYNGLLFEPMNPEKGAEKIEILINNRTLMRHYGINSGKLYEEYFIIENMLDALDKIYHNVKPSSKRIEPVFTQAVQSLF